MVAEAESTHRACKPMEVSQLLIVHGGTPNLISVGPMFTGGDAARGEPWFLSEKCDINLEKMKSELVGRTAHILALQRLYRSVVIIFSHVGADTGRLGAES